MADHDQPPLDAREFRGERVELRVVGQRQPRDDSMPRSSTTATGERSLVDRHRTAAGGVVAPAAGWQRSERFAQRKVDVHRPGAGGQCARMGAGRQRAVVDERLGRRCVVAGVDEPTHRPPEDPELVDRLAGAGVAQLGRPIGGERQQWNVALVGLGNRRVKVRHCCSRRDRDDGGLSTRARCTDGEKPGRAFVEHRHRSHIGMGGEGECERGVARSGRDHRERHSAARELVDERDDAAVDGVGSPASRRPRRRSVAHSDLPLR
ncbi:hypothetical protein HRbin41_00835 [bacterium HR41]|nr:hypothetical protein HRbin41_00835 [bacterium HR41]